MGSFRFSLAKVLEHRKESERESAAGLARARTEADIARKAKADLEAARVAGLARLAEAHGSGGSVGHLQNLAYVISRADTQIRAADAACQEADAQVVESVKDHQVAMRERKTIEGLRDRKLDRWRSDEQRAERNAMDEAALIRHMRPDRDDVKQGG